MANANDDSGVPIPLRTGEGTEELEMVFGIDWSPWSWIQVRRQLFARLAGQPWAAEIQIEPVYEMPVAMLPADAPVVDSEPMMLVWVAFRSVIPRGQQAIVALSDAVLVSRDEAGLFSKLEAFLQHAQSQIKQAVSGAGQIVVPQAKIPPVNRLRFNGEES